MNTIPRNEHPNPQFERKNFLNLNGQWDFEIDGANSGEERGLIEKETLSDKIIVPFCPESELSGIANTDFLNRVWYKKHITIDEKQLSGEAILTIGACDYKTKIWVNGTFCTEHIGGYTPISVAIGDKLKVGDNIITISAEDDIRSGKQAGGKQSPRYGNFGCFYTRTTGIWQTVMLEFVPKAYIKSVKYDSLITGDVTLTSEAENAHGMTLSADIIFNGETVASGECKIDGKCAKMALKIEDPQLWDTENPNLYDVVLKLGNDTVYSYFGIRTISYSNHRMYLNGKSIFGRFILDQGYYPDGVYTAPTDEDLKNDIIMSQSCGYNGARLHQKIFEPRFLYHCDKLGYMVWDEHANWGLDISTPGGWRGFIGEWCEIMKRDYNHPSIIGWCPFNETQRNQDNELIKAVYNLTKMTDPSRLFIDCSGWFHVDGTCDMIDCHLYEQDVEKFTRLIRLRDEPDFVGHMMTEELCFVSEFGGAHWDENNENRAESWGYGNAPKNVNDFIERYDGLVTSLLENDQICAFCYTQLTDVHQEKNGLFYFDRRPKFDCERLKKITSKKAVCED